MHFNIVTLFPEFFDSPLRTALMGRAAEAGLFSRSFHNPRDFAAGRHRSVDERPYGGGPGMVMRLEPLLRCLRAIRDPGPMLAPSPSAGPFTQAAARALAAGNAVTLICGRYEGMDARLEKLAPVEYVSVGDAVVNGGEAAALMIMEAVARLLPGFMGKEASGEEESFSRGLLEYPQYTRPESFEGERVPAFLLAGNHAWTERKRREQSLAATLRLRPELLAEAELDEEDALYLRTIPRARAGRGLYLCLVHYPVLLKDGISGASSLTNLDIHDIARISCGYGLGGVYVATPLADQARILRDIVRYWTLGAGAASNPDRARALSLVRHVEETADAVAQVEGLCGQRPAVFGTSAEWQGTRVCTPGTVRRALESGPALLVLGTARGLAPEVTAQCDALLRPLRFLSGYRHLPVRAAVAAYVDRILGDIE
jgi:tRNA (guanine37-N1)-methyltransferase